jgi:hypothetical protein
MIGWRHDRAVATPLEEAVVYRKEINLELWKLAEVMEV